MIFWGSVFTSSSVTREKLYTCLSVDLVVIDQNQAYTGSSMRMQPEISVYSIISNCYGLLESFSQDVETNADFKVFQSGNRNHLRYGGGLIIIKHINNL